MRKRALSKRVSPLECDEAASDRSRCSIPTSSVSADRSAGPNGKGRAARRSGTVIQRRRQDAVGEAAVRHLRHAHLRKKDVRKEYTSKIFELTHGRRREASAAVSAGCGGAGRQFFQGVIDRLDQRFTLFMEDGTPVRATLTCTFKEWRTNKEDRETAGLQSSDIAKRKFVRRGDTLSAIAAEEYLDPSRVAADRRGERHRRSVALASGPGAYSPEAAVEPQAADQGSHTAMADRTRFDTLAPEFRIEIDGREVAEETPRRPGQRPHPRRRGVGRDVRDQSQVLGQRRDESEMDRRRPVPRRKGRRCSYGYRDKVAEAVQRGDQWPRTGISYLRGARSSRFAASTAAIG